LVPSLHMWAYIIHVPHNIMIGPNLDSDSQSNDILLPVISLSQPRHLSTYPSRQWTYHPLGLKLVSVDVHFHYRKLIHFTNEVARGRRNGFWVLWRRPKISCKLGSVVKWRACSQLKI
jgi:hypothetical protein